QADHPGAGADHGESENLPVHRRGPAPPGDGGHRQPADHRGGPHPGGGRPAGPGAVHLQRSRCRHRRHRVQAGPDHRRLSGPAHGELNPLSRADACTGVRVFDG
ncbi:Thiamine transporter, partial [Dysosmobacter welbionis]